MNSCTHLILLTTADHSNLQQGCDVRSITFSTSPPHLPLLPYASAFLPQRGGPATHSTSCPRECPRIFHDVLVIFLNARLTFVVTWGRGQARSGKRTFAWHLKRACQRGSSFSCNRQLRDRINVTRIRVAPYCTGSGWG